MKSRSATSRHQERSDATRARLIVRRRKSSRATVSRPPSFEEIAAEAGYTRGAFYANFDSKEDLFLALLEGEVSSRINTVEQMTRSVPRPRSQAACLSGVFPTQFARTAAGACSRWN